MERKSAGLEACHIEYNYLGKHGDCIDLNTLDDTFYIFGGIKPTLKIQYASNLPCLFFAGLLDDIRVNFGILRECKWP